MGACGKNEADMGEMEGNRLVGNQQLVKYLREKMSKGSDNGDMGAVREGGGTRDGRQWRGVGHLRRHLGRRRACGKLRQGPVA